MTRARITNVAELRPSVQVEQELDWFFNRAERDVGCSSNYFAVLGVHDHDSATRSLDAAAEGAYVARRIRRALTSMESSHAGVLQCAYELRDWPAVLSDTLGRLTGVVVRLACALDRIPDDRDSLEVVEHARAQWLAGLCPRASLDSTLCRLKRDGESRFARAHREYRRVTGRSA